MVKERKITGKGGGRKKGRGKKKHEKLFVRWHRHPLLQDSPARLPLVEFLEIVRHLVVAVVVLPVRWRRELHPRVRLQVDAFANQFLPVLVLPENVGVADYDEEGARSSDADVKPLGVIEEAEVVPDVRPHVLCGAPDRRDDDDLPLLSLEVLRRPYLDTVRAHVKVLPLERTSQLHDLFVVGRDDTDLRR